jgi:hypothetical protein
MKRVTQIHHHRAPCSMVIGEQKAALGHPVFGVMHLLGFDAGGTGGKQLAIIRGGRVAINHGDEVFALTCRISRPGKYVVS